MSLDPRERKNWTGFVDALQPPPGYRLGAAIGTTFGLSIDALTAALLAMSDADGDAFADDPVPGVMAVTRLSKKVRVLVHPATISGSKPGGGRFVALLDRLIVEVQPGAGLFHPKVWALRFERASTTHSLEPSEKGRLMVCSRNLSTSTSFELAAVFEGEVADGDKNGSPFAKDVADALQAWMSLASRNGVRMPPAVWQLPAFLRQLRLELPYETSRDLRLRWQGQGRQGIMAAVPTRLRRTLVVSPFVRPDFVAEMATRTSELYLVSTAQALDGLDDVTFQKTERLREAQGSPVLYQVAELGDSSDPDGAHLDGLHAKLLVTEDARGDKATYVGSSNATGPGWGLGALSNVEAMAEMRPGIEIDAFVRGFLRETKSKVHPWVREYDRSAKAEPDPSLEAERQLLAGLREAARLGLVLRYDVDRRRMLLSCDDIRWIERFAPGQSNGVVFECAPLLLADRADAWHPVCELGDGIHFNEVPMDQLTAFVSLRASVASPPVMHIRLVLARLDLDDGTLDRRDVEVTRSFMANADRGAVLHALIGGLASYKGTGTPKRSIGSKATSNVRHLLSETSLELLLRAVAVDPTLVSSIRQLVVPFADPEFQRLCDDLDEVLQRVKGEAQL